jgi:uncharacterized membrane protein
MRDILAAVSLLDGLAVAWFLVAWMGYGWVADHSRMAAIGLLGVSHRHRLEWARQLLRRENRVADAALVGNLMDSVSFYASTTIYILAGLLALLGALDKVITATESLPFAGASSRSLWEIKLLLLLAVFVVGYFKFTWSLRLFNQLSILIGAAPPRGNRWGRRGGAHGAHQLHGRGRVQPRHPGLLLRLGGGDLVHPALAVHGHDQRGAGGAVPAGFRLPGPAGAAGGVRAGFSLRPARA